MIELKVIIKDPCDHCDWINPNTGRCTSLGSPCTDKKEYEKYVNQCDADQKILNPIVEALEKIVEIEKRADGLRGQGMVDDVDTKAMRSMANNARKALEGK